MKILLLSHTGLVTGGAEQCLIEYVDVLRDRGYECKVIVPYEGGMTKALDNKGIHWTVIGYGWATRLHKKANPHNVMVSNGSSLVRIFQEVEKFKPNVILTNTVVIPWGLYAGRVFNIPTLLLAHEIISDKDPSLNMMPNYQKYVEILNENTDYVLYNSQFVKNEFANALKLPKTSKDILYPLPPLNETKIDHYFKENNIASTVKIAIFGALSPRKNQMEALLAAKILKTRGIKNFCIHLYGDAAASPPYTQVLRRFIRKNLLTANVKVMGYATNVYEIMNEYNVVLSTATYEPFGRTIIEGQLFGKIVITNNTGGGLELVQNLSTGLVYDSGQPSQLAEKIIWIMNNQIQAKALGLKAKEVQFKKYITPSRYNPLLDAVEYCTQRAIAPNDNNMIDPVRTLFEYNHHLNNKYKRLYRLTHNRMTYRIRGVLVFVLQKTKKTLKQLLRR